MGSKDDTAQGTGPLQIREQGGFAHAACACGWRGPARRSRKRAREDATEHLGHGCRGADRR
jgi:hypothetical protein